MLGGGAAFVLATSRDARCDPLRKIIIGFLSLAQKNDSMDYLERRLAELGFVNGKEIEIEWRFARGDDATLKKMARELAAMPVDLIVASVNPAAQAALSATGTIPVVFAFVADPVENGLAQSVSRPGGNRTGTIFAGTELAAKRIQLLKEALPGAEKMALLWAPGSLTAQRSIESSELAAARLGVSLVVLPVEANGSAIAAKVGEAVKQKCQAISVLPDTRLYPLRSQIAQIMLEQRVGGIADGVQYAQSGLLLSYGINYSDNYRRTAEIAAQVLKGDAPGDIPLEYPRSYDLGVNLRTAEQLGVKVPASILLQATTVVE